MFRSVSVPDPPLIRTQRPSEYAYGIRIRIRISGKVKKKAIYNPGSVLTLKFRSGFAFRLYSRLDTVPYSNVRSDQDPNPDFRLNPDPYSYFRLILI